ncbi:DUF6207 family protein [Streptomyces sp. NPDC006290]|uniref:DUF6207 family protein n=1 Tax=Streptomyces sp. NPDC006290 TaxID=3156745 RepID=UPI0033AC52EE
MRCGRWATVTSDRTTRDPGQAGVRLRCLDVRLALFMRTVFVAGDALSLLDIEQRDGR